MDDYLYSEILDEVGKFNYLNLILVCKSFYDIIKDFGKEIKTKKEYKKVCKEGDIYSLLKIENLEDKFNINKGLFIACRRGYLEIIELMIEKGATIGIGDYLKHD